MDHVRTCLVVQRLRIHLAMQGTRVQSLAQIPHAAEQLSHCTTTTEPMRCHD